MAIGSNSIQLLGSHAKPRAAADDQLPVTLADLGVEALFDRLLDAVVIARLSTGRIVVWNPAAEKLFGYSAEEAIGRPIEMLMPEPISQLHRAGLERYMRTGHGLIIDADAPVEMPARTKHGDEIRVELSLSELQGPRGERFAVAIVRNAMLRKELELTALNLTQARVARSEAEAALEARDELIETIAATLADAPTPDELQRLVNALGSLKDLRRGLRRGRPIDIDVVDVVHATTDAARRHTASKRLAVALPPSAPVSCDPSLLRLVLDQVLADLLERIDADGRVELHVELLSPQVVQLVARAQLGAVRAPVPSATLLVSRMLLENVAGTLHVELSKTGSIEVIMTVPATRRERRSVSRRRSH